MAAENFKVKKGLEVGTGITANSDGVDVTGIVTATQFVGDGSGLTGVVGSGSGVVVKDEGSAVGTAGTINFVGTGVSASLSEGTATVTVNAGGLDNVVEDTTPELGGDLNLNSKFITGSGGINVTGVVTATTLKGDGDFVDIDVDGQTEVDDLNVSGVSTFSGNATFSGNLTTFSGSGTGAGNGGSAFALWSKSNNYLWFSDSTRILVGFDQDLEIKTSGSESIIRDTRAGAGATLAIGADKLIFRNKDGDKQYLEATDDESVKLYFNGNQKLTTTINGIEVPDLNVTGVGTVGRLDTSGVTLGTNSTTFAAKFADDAVVNLGGANDLKIYHTTSGTSWIRHTNSDEYFIIEGQQIDFRDYSTGNYFVRMGDSVTLYHSGGSPKLVTDQAGVKITGVCTATSFSGDGSGLTGVTASGTGILVKHDGSNVGTAGTINFSTNLDVTPISAGIVTVTASGGSGSIAGISTTGTSFFNQLNISGDVSTTGQFVFKDTAGEAEFKIQGHEGNSATLYLFADEGDDPADRWKTTAHTDGNLILYHYKASTSAYAKSAQFTNDAGTQLFHTSVKKFETDQAGVKITGVCTATSFSGSGIGLTSLNADNLGSGEIPNGRFPATLPAVSGANLTALNASEITSGTLPIARVGDNTVTFAKLENIPTSRLVGRTASGTGDASALTAAEVRTLLNVADGATAGITTAPSNIAATWSVGGGSGSGYQFTGPGQDGSEGNPDIYLVRGHKYRFINTTGNSHPFRFKLSANGTQYTDGISGSENGTQDFSVQHDAPASLVYQCTQHPSMVGNIYIVGQHLANGADNRVITATSAYGMNGESNLTFNGSLLNVSARITCDVNSDIDMSNSADGQLQIGGNGYTSAIALNDQGMQIYHNSSSRGIIFGIDESEKVRITSGGQVAIGTMTGVRALTIKDPGQMHLESTSTGNWVGTSLKGSSGTNNYTAYFGILDSNGNFFIDNGSNGDDFVIKQSGNIEIDSFSSPSTRTLSLRPGYTANQNGGIGLAAKDHSGSAADGLGVYGTDGVSIHTANAGTVYQRFTIDTNGNATLTGSLTQNSSDIRLKENIQPITNSLEKVKSLSGFTYNWNRTAQDLGLKGEEHDELQVGLSAQDVEKIQPEVVKPAPVDNNYKTIQYEKLVPLLIEAIKEQQEQIETLNSKVAALEGS